MVLNSDRTDKTRGRSSEEAQDNNFTDGNGGAAKGSVSIKSQVQYNSHIGRGCGGGDGLSRAGRREAGGRGGRGGSCQ